MGERKVDLKGALQCLKEQGINRLLVEGGGTLNEELLKQNLVDEISVYIAPLIFGGADAPTFASAARRPFRSNKSASKSLQMAALWFTMQ